MAIKKVLSESVELCNTSEAKTFVVKKNRKKAMIITLAVLLFLYIAVPFGLAIYIFERAYSFRVESPVYSPYIRYDDVDGYDRQLAFFYSGENKLQAYIYGENNDKGLIVMAHGIDWGAENHFVETMYFVDSGWQVFAYDNTGRYGSEGRGAISMPQAISDLEAALIYIESQNWNLPILLYGHSLGGYAVTAIQNYDLPININAIVSISGFSSPVAVKHEVARDHIGLGFIATWGYPHTWLYNRFLFGKNANLSAIDGINSGEIPTLIIHGTDDHLILYGGSSITSQRNKIINPNAVFITRDVSPNNGHSTLWLVPESATYRAEMIEAYDNLEEYYNGNIPDEVLFDFYNEYRNKVNTLDVSFMDKINVFFEINLEQR